MRSCGILDRGSAFRRALTVADRKRGRGRRGISPAVEALEGRVVLSESFVDSPQTIEVGPEPQLVAYGHADVGGTTRTFLASTVSGRVSVSLDDGQGRFAAAK